MREQAQSLARAPPDRDRRTATVYALIQMAVEGMHMRPNHRALRMRVEATIRGDSKRALRSLDDRYPRRIPGVPEQEGPALWIDELGRVDYIVPPA